MVKRIFKSALGEITLISENRHLIYCNWNSEECRYKEDKLYKLKVNKACRNYENFHINEVSNGNEFASDNDIIEETVCQLKEYFEGKRKLFNLPMKLTGTKFQIKVWKQMMDIDYAQTVSYKQLAGNIGYERAARAVAAACGANPIAIILPCHRVIASQNKIGGYTGGIEKKESLLSLENQNIIKVK